MGSIERRLKRKQETVDLAKRSKVVGDRIGKVVNGEHPEVVINVCFRIANHVCSQNGVELADVFADFIEQEAKAKAPPIVKGGN